MDLTLSDEQRSIVDSVREVLTDSLPIEGARAVVDGDTSGLDRLWAQAAELGWFGLGLPESAGGTGLDLVDEALLFKELGRLVTPGPFLGTVLGARVAALAGASDVADQLLAGSTRVGVATASPAGGYVLHDAVGAAYLLIADGENAVLVATGAASDRHALPSLDELSTREAATIDLTPVARISAAEDPILVRGSVLVAAILTGIAEATRDMSVSHAKTREQFGAAIGTFQAIKHRCADMGVSAALADAQLLFAALSVTEQHTDAALQVAAARVVASRAALWNSRETVQVFGGMGFTWECNAHFYVKRTHAMRDLFGDVKAHQPALL
jgi:alkylation response protein AidB-like acyl-CoA dehydrogenase